VGFPNSPKPAFQQSLDERFRLEVQLALFPLEAFVPVWSALQIPSNYCSPHFVLCLIGGIEKGVIFKTCVVFVEEFSFSLLEIRISEVCHLDNDQSWAAGSTPLF